MKRCGIKGVGRFNVRCHPSPSSIYYRRSASHTFYARVPRLSQRSATLGDSQVPEVTILHLERLRSLHDLVDSNQDDSEAYIPQGASQNKSPNEFGGNLMLNRIDIDPNLQCIYSPSAAGRTSMRLEGKTSGPYRRNIAAGRDLVSNQPYSSIRKFILPKLSTSFFDQSC